MAKKKIKHGFTLVEVLVAVIIISILTGISTLAYYGLQAQGRDKTRQTNASIIAEQLEKYYDQNGEYPSVPSLVGQTGSYVKNKLKLSDASVLVLPQAPSGTTNSLTQSNASATQLAYNGENVNTDDGNCTTDVDGGCDQFTLQWQSESGDLLEIQSRHSGRSTANVPTPPPAAPSAPNISAEFSDPNVVATVEAVSCEAGSTPEYKIINASNTTGDDPVFPDWSTVSWQTTLTSSVTGVEGTHYYFKAIAHCVNSGGPSNESPESDVVEFYYVTAGAPALNATISGTTVSVSIVPTTCPSGSTAKYQIWEKKDTTTAAGSMAVISTRNFTTTATYSTTAGGTSSPTKHTFRAYTRCDSGTSQGVVSPASTDVVVVSAPAAPSLSSNRSSSGNADSVTWSWSSPVCPVGTTRVFNYQWTGNYTNSGSSANTSSTSISLTSSSQGYTYGLHVRVSCGTAVANRVLTSGWSNNVTFLRDVTSKVWAYKGSVRIRRPEPGNYPNKIFGQAVIHTSRDDNTRRNYNTDYPSQSYPNNAYCASGLTRQVRWQWSANHVGVDTGWRYGSTSNGYSPWYTWANGTDKTFPSGGSVSDYSGPEDDLDAGDKWEVRFWTRCLNASTNVAGNDVDSDNFGNITVESNTGNFRVYCDVSAAPVPWCYPWHSEKNPLSSHTGYNASGSASGVCRSVADGDQYCFAPHNSNYGPNGSPWGW